MSIASMEDNHPRQVQWPQEMLKKQRISRRQEMLKKSREIQQINEQQRKKQPKPTIVILYER